MSKWLTNDMPLNVKCLLLCDNSIEVYITKYYISFTTIIM